MSFILCGFEHCVANIFYIVCGDPTWSSLVFVFICIIGNSFGGIFMKHLIKESKHENN
jgi:formate/nitrite transporter FocA (FNT family)